MDIRDPDFTLDEVQERLDYDPSTGSLTHRYDHDGVYAGQEAGYIDRRGYRRLKIRNEHVFAHRLIWFYVHGEWPGHIDHKNGVKSDNRIDNLRPATKVENGANIKKVRADSLTGMKGVKTLRQKKRGKEFVYYMAMAQVRGVRTNLGTFKEPEHAATAYRIYRTIMDGDFFAG